MTADVAIVGAGVIGCAIARVLAGEGLHVVVVDRDEPGSHASWAAAGMLAPQAESDGPDPLLPLLLQSRSLFRRLAEELKDETGVDVAYSTHGMLLVATDDTARLRLEDKLVWQRGLGLDVEPLTGDEARRLEPVLSSSVSFALRFGGDHQVDNRALTRALWISAAERGAQFRIGRSCRQLRRVQDGCELEMDDRERLAARFAVLAAGSWSGLMVGLPRILPVEPVHGQLLSLGISPDTIQHTIASDRGYFVPRLDGRLIVGATVEHTGFRTAVTATGLNHLTGAVMTILPALADSPVTAQWSGLRPGTPDGLPILGPDPEIPALLYATGHYRNGILLAPLTAELIGDIILGNPSRIDLEPFAANRFEVPPRTALG